eukprot:6058243-Heterocapsa_arctica.AAC.1
MDSEDQFRQKLLDLDSFGYRNDKRKAKQRVGKYSQGEDEGKRFRATDLEKTKASDSGVVSIPVNVLQKSPNSLKRPA